MNHLTRLTVLSLLSVPVFASTYPDEINYPYFENIYQKENQTLESLTRQMNALISEVDSLDSNLNRMRTTYNNYSNERVNINNTLRNLSSEASSLSSQLDRLKRDERDLSNRISRAQNNYDRIRRDVDNETRRLNPIRDQINRVQREVQNIRNEQSNVSRQLNSAQYELRTAQNELNRVQSDISRLSSTPNRTPQQESELSRLRQRQSSLQMEVSRKQSNVTTYQSRASQIMSQLSQKENELRMAQSQYDREASRLRVLEQQMGQAQREVNQLNDSFRATRASITNAETRISRIRVETSSLETRRREIELSQSRLEQDIRTSENRLAQASTELRRVQNQVSNQTSVAQRAYDQYLSRYNMYVRYYEEAQALGEKQVATAGDQGNKQGLADAKSKGQKLGSSSASILSKAQGNLWGAMRAEVEGYNIGFEVGYNSPKTEAQAQAKKDAKAKATSYVESVVRPQYFEEELIKEIKKPYNLKSVSNAQFSLSRELESLMYRENFQNKFEVTEKEKEASLKLVTDYDSIIADFIKEEESAQKKREEAANAVLSYSMQEKYPFDKVNCTTVYKNVADFKKACEESFKARYIGIFEDNAYDTYLKNFSQYFEEAFGKQYEASIASNYKQAYDLAYESSHAYGVVKGKEVMFTEAYQNQFEISYPEFVVAEKQRVKEEVPQELAQFLQANALLTVASVKFDEEIIAGEEISLETHVRNIGKTKSGVGTIKIAGGELIESISKEVLTSEIPAGKILAGQSPKFRVSSKALTGQTIKVQVEANLPGDKYKSMRKEVITFEKKVAANPAQNLKLNVDLSPSIRNVLRRFLIHTLSVEVSPKYESLKETLDVRLAVLEGAEHIDQKNTQEKLTATNMGSKKTIKFSYVFKDSADGKSIKLQMQFVRKGKIVQTENIELKPH